VNGAALLQMHFTATDLPRLRSRVGGTASLAGLDEQRCEELVLAAYELASNAIRHGGGGGHLRLSRENGSLHCQVSDEGPGFDGAADSPGRGLLLVRELVDGIEINRGAGAVVTLTVHCRAPREPAD
jgi:anti-sigma regulatory factor (Ser/Thr protein kinase)